ncbi:MULTISPECIES: hypothetical protein [Vagococcus]|uniref:Uncharacterized protein n=1 Tax=Vagococcus fluvialis bH819 TaxID=1255619 RepID=A0A1X6WMH8_9ENTE|nr:MULTISPECIES: hypothetical protein [Vagococcus]SLM85469.1 hypothetical protein FM121_05175 [Vagococcus fluvialis bH819]HCM89237.1 hypothetical protein [Vagococcus sp.]
MAINEDGTFNFKVDETPLLTEASGSLKNTFTDPEQTEIPSNMWKKTYRRTNQNELTNIIKDATITQSSLIRLIGSYSTKMLSSLKIDKSLTSGIEHRPSKVFYNNNLNINQALTNDMLSYIPYSLNYLNSISEDTNNKLYLDNFTIFNNNLYFTIFLNEEYSIATECIYLEQKDILTNHIQTLKTDTNLLKIFITDTFNTKSALDMLTANLKEDFIFVTLNKSFKVMYLSIHSQDTKIQFNKQSLQKITDKKQRYQDTELYELIKEKYEFKRNIIPCKK